MPIMIQRITYKVSLSSNTNDILSLLSTMLNQGQHNKPNKSQIDKAKGIYLCQLGYHTMLPIYCETHRYSYCLGELSLALF